MKKIDLVLLPGLITDRRLWQQQIAGLADMADAWVADLTTEDSMAALAARVLAGVPSRRFALAGLSMGGYVALEVIRQAPERIVALALLDTSARPETPESTANRRKLIEQAQADFSAMLDALVPKLVHPDHLADPAIGGLAKAMGRDAGQAVFLRQQTAIMARIDSRPSLAGICCPTLVLAGRQDALMPLEIHEEMSSAIAGSRLVMIDHCGHLATLEQTRQVTDALHAWLVGAG